MEYLRLSDCADFALDRTSNIAIENYISTENMIPNKGGITIASTIPDAKTTPAYKPNDILLSNIRPYFCKIWLADKEGSCSNDVLVVRAKKGINSKFLYYVLSDNNFFNWDTVTSKGTKMPRGTPKAIMKYFVPDVDNMVQERIANILSRYDEAIENNNKRIKLLEQIIEKYYKHLFSYEKIKNNLKKITLNEILSITRGLSYSSEEIECEDGDNLINLKNLQGYGGYRLDGTKKYNGKYKIEQVVNEGDLIMGVTDMTQDRRTVGSVALIPRVSGTNVISADLVKINSNYNKIYLYSLFRYGGVSKYLAQFANGANVLHLRPDTILRTKIQLPNNELIEKFTNTATPLVNKINILNEANFNLAKQRDLLLPRLMSGKLEVK